MIIKKIGHLLLIRLKLFQVLAKLSPLGILISFLLAFFMFHLKQEYKFEEPSLRTRLEDVSQYKSSLSLPYKELTAGVKYVKILGAIQNQCLLLTFPQEHENSEEVKNIFETFSKGSYNPKNIVLLSYSDVFALNRFFDWYYNPLKNGKFSFGIIRIGLNIDFSSKATNIQSKQKETSNKAIFNIYSSTMHPDLDYYQAIKELLHLTLFTYLPCEEIQREPLRSMKLGFIKLGKLLKRKDQMRGFADHFLCQFNNHIKYSLTPHQVMMKNGFQSSSLKFLQINSTQKAESVVVSFLKEFSLQEEHLHSARVFFYPMSRTEQLPIFFFISSSLVFLISIILKLIDHYLHLYEKVNFDLPYSTLLLIWIWIWEYNLTSDTFYTIVTAIIFTFLSIFLEIRKGFLLKIKQIPFNYVELVVIPFSALISLYFGLFCYSLSIVTMFCTLVQLLKPQKIVFRIAYKIFMLSLFIFRLKVQHCFCFMGISFQFEQSDSNSIDRDVSAVRSLKGNIDLYLHFLRIFEGVGLKIMFSNDKKGFGRQITKTTLKAQSIVSILLEQFIHLKPKLGKLIGDHSIDQMKLDDIVTICKKIPKNLERNIHINHQLEINQQLQQMVDTFFKSKGKKGKPYALFLLWKNFQEKLIQRVQVGIKGKTDPSDTNSDNFKLMSFIEDLEYMTSTFEDWANNKTREIKMAQIQNNRLSQQNNVQLIFPKTPTKTGAQSFLPSNRETATSTALVSGKMSKHEKKSDRKDFSSHSRAPSENLLFRASTAKLERKELKMAVRCPSAANTLKNQMYQQPHFEVKRSSKLQNQMSMRLISEKRIKNPGFSQFMNQKNSHFDRKDSFLLPPNNADSNLNMSFLESNKSSKDLLSIEQLENGENRSKKKKATIRDSIFKSLSPSNQDLNGKFDMHKIVRKSERKRTVFSSRLLSRSKIQQPDLELKVDLEQITPEQSIFEIDDQDFKVKPKKKVTYKKVRRSGKYLVQEKDTWVDISRFAQNKKSAKELQSSRRRKAILPSNNGQFGDLKNNFEAEEQLDQQRKFQFEQNVFLAVTDVLKSCKKMKTTRQQTKEKARPNSLSNILAELNNFIEENPFKKQENFGSIFFRQQQKLRESEDEAYKDRITKMTKHQSHCSNIFEMGYKSVSNKDVIYNQMHRNECFLSDEDWIKHMIGLNGELLQKAL